MTKMSENVEFSEETLRKIAAQKVTFRYTVKVHAICYGLVNLLLIIINLIVAPTYLWGLYAVFGWLIGLAIHILIYLLWSRGVSYGKRAIILHITIFGLTMLLLIVVNYLTAGTLDWVAYPAISWGFGFLVHVILHYYLTSIRSGNKEDRLTRRERAIEKELEKMRQRRKREQGV